MNAIQGIIFNHGNDWSVWMPERMSARDQATIREICEKYQNEGCSVRGHHVREDIEKIMEG